ncbi:MAG: YvrJ family protein [Clostridiales bacterium]|nr:YvrJ family protein [Clostridiales bacterium]
MKGGSTDGRSMYLLIRIEGKMDKLSETIAKLSSALEKF